MAPLGIETRIISASGPETITPFGGSPASEPGLVLVGVLATSNRATGAEQMHQSELFNDVNPFLRALAPSDLEYLSPYMQRVSVSEGEVVIDVGSPVEKVFFPESVVIARFAIMQDGRSIQISGGGCDQAIGLIDVATGMPATYRATVQVAGDAVVLPASVLQERIINSQRLSQQLFLSARMRTIHAARDIACATFHSAIQRLARWLLSISDGAKQEVVMSTQERLAGILGVQRTTITSAAIVLRDAGAIIYNRGRLLIRDRSKLEATACDCYREASKERSHPRAGSVPLLTAGQPSGG